jgi:predicted DCC family thiol-disulfide oxidoreductase YuxK
MGSPDPVIGKVILFDGVCNLCNHSVQFIIRHDPVGQFKFAALQSPFGQEQLRKFGIPQEALNSVILISKDAAFQRSDAALEIARYLTGMWRGLYYFKVIPRFVRDWIYDRISKNRYSLFGKRDECMIPTPELKARFITQ